MTRSTSRAGFRAQIRRKASVSPSRVSPVSSTSWGGRGYSSGSLVKTFLAAASKSRSSSALSRNRLYSSRRRISSVSGSSSPSSGAGDLGSMARLLISTSVAAMTRKSLASSIFRSGALRTRDRYCSVISLTNISRISICAFPIRVSRRSRGPSKSFSRKFIVIVRIPSRSCQNRIFMNSPATWVKQKFATVLKALLSTPLRQINRNAKWMICMAWGDRASSSLPLKKI